MIDNLHTADLLGSKITNKMVGQSFTYCFKLREPKP